AATRFPVRTSDSAKATADESDSTTASIFEMVMTRTTDSPAVSVIVPVYNEEENVPILQAELRAALKGVDHEFIFVDDGSSDHTVERIEAAAEGGSYCLQKKRGKRRRALRGTPSRAGANPLSAGRRLKK